MAWAYVALGGAAVTALIPLIDKRIMHGYARTAQTQPLGIGLVMPFVGVAFVLVSGIPHAEDGDAVLWALVSGACYGLGANLLLHVLYRQEVSRAVPVFQTYPVFTALLAFVFLGERLDALAWAAIVAVVAGAALMSARIGAGAGRALPLRAFLLLLLGALIEGSSYVFGKSAVNELPVLATHGLRMIALGCVLSAFNLRREPLADLTRFVRERSPALGWIALNQFVVANLGLLALVWALSLGPTGPVTALASLRTFFLVVFSLAVSLVWRGALGEELTPRSVAVKLAATALIVAGAAVIATRAG